MLADFILTPVYFLQRIPAKQKKMNPNVIIAIVLSFCISFFVTETAIRLSQHLGAGDAPSEARKLHQKKIPNIGGIAIFVATMFTYFAFSDYSDVIRPDKIFSIAIFLFFIGLWDDVEPVNAVVRLLMEVACAVFIIGMAGIRFTTLWGIFGINELSIYGSYALTSIFIVGCINAFNFIDGLDGLLVSLSLLGSVCFGLIFKFSGEWLWTLLCISMCSALAGFWWFNRHPAKIFMGDGGALFLGTIFACFALRIMQLHPIHIGNWSFPALHTLAYGIISLPLTDMMVVFVTRLANGIHPFKADNRHIHHRIYQLGCNHTKCVLVLLAMNVSTIVFACLVQQQGALRSFIYTVLFCLTVELSVIYSTIIIKRAKKIV
jgi:UDP-N-acetylmuramyl pentapeptide phosphotransferase/UDP-N-acetylglucosamine-1-phosphate transferase